MIIRMSAKQKYIKTVIMLKFIIKLSSDDYKDISKAEI